MFREDYTSIEERPVTYSLRAGAGNSNGYYQAIGEVADSFLEKWEHEARSLREHFIEWLREGEREPLRDGREYTFDILTLGVMWRMYGGRVRQVPAPAALLCSALYRLRRRWPRLKPWADDLRGRLMTRFLTGDGSEDGSMRTPDQTDLRALLRWMDATGEYREETRRLVLLVSYLETCIPEERSWYLEHVITMANSFILESDRMLGNYTSGVIRFLRETAGGYHGREDVLLVSRKREEYHLAMLGAELMNRAFADGYAATTERAILLPACMRGASAVSCRAKRVGLDMSCTHCDRGCRVSQVTRAAAERGVSAHIIPHSSDFTRWLRAWAEGRNVGVIGVACVLHLITGGLELRSLGIAAQCVLLDFCGCSQHWDPAGRQTDLNQGLLLETAEMTGAAMARGIPRLS